MPRESSYRGYPQSYLSPIERDVSQRKRSVHSRQKYKAQYEAIENNLRLDIAKYKAKIQELEKSNEEKERLNKKLSKEISAIQMSEYNQIYYNEEMQNKNKLLETYENYLKEIRKDCEQARGKRMELEKSLFSFEEAKKY